MRPLEIAMATDSIECVTQLLDAGAEPRFEEVQVCALSARAPSSLELHAHELHAQMSSSSLWHSLRTPSSAAVSPCLVYEHPDEATTSH